MCFRALIANIRALIAIMQKDENRSPVHIAETIAESTKRYVASGMGTISGRVKRLCGIKGHFKSIKGVINWSEN